jgi:hypothetical protein
MDEQEEFAREGERIVPVGTKGNAISLRVSSEENACKIVKQIETPRLTDPVMLRPGADREEKRVTHANETKRKKGSTGQLDFDPNQKSLLERCFRKVTD